MKRDSYVVFRGKRIFFESSSFKIAVRYFLEKYKPGYCRLANKSYWKSVWS